MVAPAVAQAAMDSGVATRPIADMPAYRQRLSQFVYQSGSSMQPLFAAAKRAPKRVVYAEGEDERVLRAAQVVVDEGLARPLLLGRPEVIAQRIAEFGLRLALGKDCEIVDLLDPAVYGDAADDYYQLKRRDGVSRAVARAEMRSRGTLLAAMLVRQGRADAMLCGTFGSYGDHLRHVRDVIGLRPGTQTLAAMQMLMLPGRQLFICDTHVNRDPERRAGRRDRAAGGRGGAPLRRHAERGAAVALELRRLGRGLGGEDARRRWRSSRRAIRSSRSKARCAATRRCPRPSSTASSRTRA